MAAFVPLSEFDFAVQVPMPTAVVKAGQTVRIPIQVQTLRGDSRPVHLTAGDWGSVGLSADIAPPSIPSGGTATLYVTIPAGTPPGSYLLTVRGSAEGTFKTSSAAVTVVVEPDQEEKKDDDQRGDGRGHVGPDGQGEPTVSASPVRAKRGVLARSARKAPARPMPAGQRALFIAIMFVMAGVLMYYLLGSQFRAGSGGSAGGMGGTYVGTSTFCIASVMGGSPECGTSTTPEIQIDSAGNVLGPVLFGKIYADNTFDGDAYAGDGMEFHMDGTYSSGTLAVEYKSDSVTWTITLHRE